MRAPGGASAAFLFSNAVSGCRYQVVPYEFTLAIQVEPLLINADDDLGVHSSLELPRPDMPDIQITPRSGVGLNARSCFIDQPPLKCLSLVRKNGHRGRHAFEAELAIKGLLAWHRIQDDLLVVF